jgi:DNA-binding MarR family transcriptional regulator
MWGGWYHCNMQQMHSARSDACAGSLLETTPLVMRVIRAQMRGSRAADLSVAQFRALGFIGRRPATSLADLAEHIGLSPAAASRLVDGLVARGYVDRRGSTSDRRLVELRVLPEGAAITEATRAAARAHLRDRLGALSDEQLDLIGEASALLREVFAAEGRAAATAATRAADVGGRDAQ